MSHAKSRRKSAPVLFKRQRHLLALLDAVGGRAGNLDFQKLLFLYCQESRTSAYEFVPYKYGAFSFTSYADRRKLVERGLLEDEEHHWHITDEGKRRIGQTRDLRISAFAHRYRALRGDALVAETYRRFPYYATRSEIAERVLRGDDAALRRIEAAARPAPDTAAVSTIGYEGRTLESFLNALLRSGVTLLCDVRRNPISRKYGFSKRTLANGCAGVGIVYEHLPELGIASEQRQALKTPADYDALFAIYERESLPQQGQALARIQRWIRSGERVALTCYERLPQQCHRHCVAKALERGFDDAVTAAHL